ncbi:MAG TPA: DUF1080 domain-containing protein [Rhodospirillales bacterium]|nr:DUF1080 domain-containing protein [Rhodospirillales bacterium]
MKKLCCLPLCFFVFSLATAGVWKEDFDNGMPKGWETIKGKWKVDKKALTETRSETYSKIMFGDVTWKDYSVAIDVIVGKGKHPCNCVGFLIRADEKGENGYRFWIRTDQHMGQVSRWVNNKYEHLKTPIPPKAESGKTYRLKVVAKGKNFQFFLDDKLLFEGEDKAQPRFQPNGRIGLICHETNPYFDNLVIEGDQIPASLVKPLAKISVYWGKIKSLISTL